MDTYIYKIDDAIYINLTNQCTNDCSFCVRNTHDGVSGYHLLLEKEPTTDDIIKELEKQDNVEKIVFCGLGEPTIRIEVLLEVARYLKSRGSIIRVNTNGQGSAYAEYDIAEHMRGIVDTVSISLNASSAKAYQELCHSVYGEQAYAHLLEFAKSCLAQGIETVLSVVDIIGEDETKECRHIANQIGAKLRIRHYIA